ncbi:hypothetical protein FQZ97_643730 [compost metagenome]
MFLRLDAAPYTLRLSDDNRSLLTHTNAVIDTVEAWKLDDAGQLYAMTSLGAGIVLDRDLPPLLEKLATDSGAPLLDALADLPRGGTIQAAFPGAYPAAPLSLIAQENVAQELGFDPDPRPQAA